MGFNAGLSAEAACFGPHAAGRSYISRSAGHSTMPASAETGIGLKASNFTVENRAVCIYN